MARNKPDKIEPDTYLSSHEVGAFLQCNPSSVNKWVKEGKIIAHRTPGGHRRMRAADVVAFLRKYKMPIPKELVLTPVMLPIPMGMPAAVLSKIKAPPKVHKAKPTTKKRAVRR